MIPTSSLGRTAFLVTAVLVATLSSGELAAQDQPVREAVEVTRIGGIDAPLEAAWVRPPRVAIGPDGFAYARDATRVTVFDPDGHVIRVLGGQGRGPSEFLRTSGHGFIGDTLWVVDGRQNKAVFFAPDGEFLTTRELEAPRGQRYVLPDGGLLYTSGGIRGGRQRTRAPLVLRTGRETRGDTLLVREVNEGLFIPEIGSFAYSPLPRSPQFDLSSDSKTLAYVTWQPDQPAVSVTVLDTRTGAARERTVSLELKPLPEAVADSLIQEGVDMAEPHAEAVRRRGWSPPTNLRRAVRDGLRIPEFVPPVQHVTVANDGSVWLHLSDVGWGGELLVLPADEGPAFRIDVPDGIRMEDVMPSGFWASARGALDTPIVMQFRLRN